MTPACAALLVHDPTAGDRPERDDRGRRARRLAGAEIVSALGGRRDVRDKTWDEGAWLDPVCEVDRSVEALIRATPAERFPDHDVWDVAGEIALVEAAGGAARIRDRDGAWRRFERFEAPDGDLARRRGEIALGSAEAPDARLGA